jgi:DNA-binding NarL/FixJ family response regulator
MKMPIRVLLADDHILVRQGIKSLLEREGIQVVGEARDGQEVIQLAAKHSPDVAVIDVGMPLLNGLDATRELKRFAPKTKTILLTRHDEDEYLIEALRAGAKGYVLKNQAASDLVQAIQLVCRGQVYLSPGMSSVVVNAYLSKAELPVDPITSREREVLQLIAEGKSTRDIASLLGISVKTADSHRSRLMRKLDIHEVASLVRYAVRKHLVQP